MADSGRTTVDALEVIQPTLDELQHWTGVMGRAQQMILDYAARQGGRPADQPPLPDLAKLFAPPMNFGIDKIGRASCRERVSMWV